MPNFVLPHTLRPMLAASLMLAGVADAAVAGPYEDATTAYQRGDYVSSYRLLLPLAEKGDASAQTSVGTMYAEGKGVPQDYAEALKWFRKAADLGDALAQHNLGWAYDSGTGVPQNYAEAAKWYRLAANQGDATSQTNLGVLYAKGKGVPQDYAEAVNLYRLAADQGVAQAQSNLGLMYFQGRGVPQDYVIAHMWLNLSAAQGNDDGIKYRNIVAERMTPPDCRGAEVSPRVEAEAGTIKTRTVLLLPKHSPLMLLAHFVGDARPR